MKEKAAGRVIPGGSINELAMGIQAKKRPNDSTEDQPSKKAQKRAAKQPFIEVRNFIS